jgi:hypothetical protein
MEGCWEEGGGIRVYCIYVHACVRETTRHWGFSTNNKEKEKGSQDIGV